MLIFSLNRKDIQNEYRKNFKSAFQSDKEKYGFEQQTSNKTDNKVISNGYTYDPAWYKEVLELRKKAGEYRVSQRKLKKVYIHQLQKLLSLLSLVSVTRFANILKSIMHQINISLISRKYILLFNQNRGWKGETHRELANKQADLWDQVSRRSSLSALSLASSIRPITKEDKERENKNKSSPTKPSGRRVPGSARLIDNRTITDGNLYGRLKRETIRHHLERTTGPGIYACKDKLSKNH